MPIEWKPGKRPVFVGAGSTKAVRYGQKSLSALTNEAVMNAIADAGLQPADIDGISSYPSAPYPVARNIPGFDIVDVVHMEQIVPFENIRWFCQSSGPMIATSVLEAANALGSGVCNYALVYRALHHPAGERYGQTGARTAGGNAAFMTPYGFGVYNQQQAIHYQRYLSKFGAKREEMATIVLDANRKAQLNDYAVWQGREITFDDYMNSRLIAYPMCIFDNDMPVDQASAVIMTTEDRAKDTPHPGGYIAGMGISVINKSKSRVIQHLEEVYEYEQQHSKNLYESAGLKPDDVDLIHVYNGFSPMVWNWLEVFGFCGIGEAHEWIQGGTIGLDGPHPVNTSGGNLGEGRLHGMAHIVETARQMMGTAGPRQLPRAGGQLKKLDVALCEVGPFPAGASFLCTRT